MNYYGIELGFVEETMFCVLGDPDGYNMTQFQTYDFWWSLGKPRLRLYISKMSQPEIRCLIDNRYWMGVSSLPSGTLDLMFPSTSIWRAPWDSTKGRLDLWLAGLLELFPCEKVDYDGKIT